MSNAKESSARRIQITETPNGGYIVEAKGGSEFELPNVEGAYSDFRDLMDAMPGLMGVSDRETDEWPGFDDCGCICGGCDVDARADEAERDLERAAFQKLLDEIPEKMARRKR